MQDFIYHSSTLVLLTKVGRIYRYSLSDSLIWKLSCVQPERLHSPIHLMLVIPLYCLHLCVSDWESLCVCVYVYVYRLSLVLELQGWMEKSFTVKNLLKALRLIFKTPCQLWSHLSSLPLFLSPSSKWVIILSPPLTPCQSFDTKI